MRIFFFILFFLTSFSAFAQEDVVRINAVPGIKEKVFDDKLRGFQKRNLLGPDSAVKFKLVCVALKNGPAPLGLVDGKISLFDHFAIAINNVGSINIVKDSVGVFEKEEFRGLIKVRLKEKSEMLSFNDLKKELKIPASETVKVFFDNTPVKNPELVFVDKDLRKKLVKKPSGWEVYILGELCKNHKNISR